MRIFFGRNSDASFIERDLKILKSRHQVLSRNLRHFNPCRWIGDVFGVLGSQVVVLWFASLRSLPVLLAAVAFGKKIVTVVGGYEAANMPKLDYGQARFTIKRAVTRLILLSSNLILAVSRSSLDEIHQNLGIPKDRITLLYHGFEDIAAGADLHKEQLIVNIGNVNKVTWLKKGIKDFIEVAELMPVVRFVHVGAVKLDLEKQLGRKLPPNLEFIGQVPFVQLGDYLSSARVYLQLSRHESFGCSLAEAMLFQCVPVVTNAFALPEVVGDCGKVLTSHRLEDVRATVAEALALPESEGRRARERILEHFSYEVREKRLLQLIESLRK